MDSKTYWDNHFKKIDDEGWSDYPSLFAQFSLSYLPKDGKILELGAGLGNDSRYFARHGYRVTSTDISDEALHISQWETLNQKLNVDYLNLDLRNPFPFENESFDAVYGHAIFQYFDNPITSQIVDEISRVLVPEGVFSTLIRSVNDPVIGQLEKVNDVFYKLPNGILERFYSTQEFLKIVEGKFTPLVIDSEGQHLETEHDTYLRFIGRKNL